MRALRTALTVAACALLAACAGPQSALDPAGRDAERIATLFWWMAAGAVVIWLAMIGLFLYAYWGRPRAHSPRAAHWLIVGGGAVFPVVVLAVLLSFGLSLVPDLRRPVADPGAPRLLVSGEQWWWRVRYPPAAEGGAPVELANEIRLPVGEAAELTLVSPDVVHSFWVPSIAGKLDMVPGRRTRLVVEPTRTGRFRGACAELCGASHAWMAFDVVVVPRPEYDGWLAAQRR
ncbi:MAG TPA: cytochrome c oxidase subunit II, partial [Thermoanaerobaculia bacterium]|nr:cytochrome c oxidase subunit II [Thermoanaerobaculia bacterium]